MLLVSKAFSPGCNIWYPNPLIWSLSVFEVLGNLSEISSSCSFLQFLMSLSILRPLLLNVQFVSLFHLSALDWLLQNEGVLSFRAGRSQELIQEVSLILHWMKKMITLLKVGEKGFGSCRGIWATSIISPHEWQKGINFCFCLVYYSSEFQLNRTVKESH